MKEARPAGRGTCPFLKHSLICCCLRWRTLCLLGYYSNIGSHTGSTIGLCSLISIDFEGYGCASGIQRECQTVHLPSSATCPTSLGCLTSLSAWDQIIGTDLN